MFNYFGVLIELRFEDIVARCENGFWCLNNFLGKYEKPIMTKIKGLTLFIVINIFFIYSSY